MYALPSFARIMASIHRTLRITGKVQGVWYRKNAVDKGSELGLSGTARNMDDGSVAIEVEGPAPDVEAFIAWCWQGPPLARVEAVTISEGTVTELKGFHVAH